MAHRFGADIVLIDVEAVDAKACGLPHWRKAASNSSVTAAARSWAATTAGIRYSTWRDNVNIEVGINRVMVRTAATAGEFTLTASVAKPEGDFLGAGKWDAIKPATLTLRSAPRSQERPRHRVSPPLQLRPRP